jgi:hypothetical protein
VAKEEAQNYSPPEPLHSSALAAEVNRLRKQAPLQPKKADPGAARFTLSFEPELFPELQSYRDVVFEVQEKDRKKGMELLSIVWDHLELKNVSAKKQYRIDMELYANPRKRINARKETIFVTPAFEGRNYDEAMAVFKERDKRYRAVLVKKTKELEAAQARLAKLEKEGKTLEREHIVEQFSEQVNNADALIRFYVPRFGIYNSDCPMPPQPPLIVLLSFNNPEGKSQDVGTVYQMLLNKNALITHTYNQCCNNTFTYLHGDTMVLFTVFSDGKIGFCTKEDCLALPAKGAHTIALRMSKEKFQSIDDVKTFLGFGPGRRG